MKFGLALFATDQSIGAVEAARAAEAHGFESFWLPEHTHIPVKRVSPWPGGTELPERYKRTYDQFVLLGALAVTTKTILLGTGITLVIQRDTIITAKEVASVDQLSGGRLIFGIGGGWNLEEMADHGTDPRRRWSRMREQVLAMKEIWTKDEAEFHGQQVDFDPLWSWPKPFQKPHPPIVIGGNAENTLKRVVEYGDGWIPNAGRSERPLGEQIADLQRLAAEAGRGHLEVTVYGSRATPEEIEEYRLAGVDRIVFWLPSEAPDAVLARVEMIEELVRPFLAA